MTQTPDFAPAVSFDGAVKHYGAVRAVDGVHLAVRRGETVALLGRNGAGKSSTIGLLLGLNEPDAGQVRLFGDTPGRAVRAGRIGAMLQDGAGVPGVTVRELVAFVASTYPRPMPVAQALALAGLTDFAGRRVDKLSGGQTQRVRFAVALAGNPQLAVLLHAARPRHRLDRARQAPLPCRSRPERTGRTGREAPGRLGRRQRRVRDVHLRDGDGCDRRALRDGQGTPRNTGGTGPHGGGTGTPALLPGSARPAGPHPVGDRREVRGRAPARPARHGRRAGTGLRHRVGRPPGPHRDP
ncbi:ATP-binding cassette domain-containing protein [Streptomyces finlayi]|uniref:ATP-binding cassette domain-containing protein n=1 Tax=Streptomyces finlayi TaxID=67296 RepID=A0A7G7BQX0_9ACTN|nr:ATP-binding cassette domain-containing protein [Streptomyces finlayi]